MQRAPLKRPIHLLTLGLASPSPPVLSPDQERTIVFGSTESLAFDESQRYLPLLLGGEDKR